MVRVVVLSFKKKPDHHHLFPNRYFYQYVFILLSIKQLFKTEIRIRIYMSNSLQIIFHALFFRD